MTSFKEHPELSLKPLLSAKHLRSISLAGPKYHLASAVSLLPGALGRPSPPGSAFGQRPPDPFRLGGNQIQWHLRSFFWELIAAFDLMLIWANEHFRLGISERKVTWAAVKKGLEATARTDKQCAVVLAELQDAQQSAWLFEIRAYRNYSHRSFLGITALGNRMGDANFFLPHARVGQESYADLREQLPSYLLQMERLASKVFA